MAHVFLVAFEVDVAGGDRDAAEDYLIGALVSLRAGREDKIESWRMDEWTSGVEGANERGV
jgi:hypothetical protein